MIKKYFLSSSAISTSFLCCITLFFSSLVFKSNAQINDSTSLSYGDEWWQTKSLQTHDDCLWKVGIKIWQNQLGEWNLADDKSGITDEMKKGVTDWESDDGGDFALIGALQFIWYPKEVSSEDKFEEDWPKVARALDAKGYPIKKWMWQPCPWKTQEEFNEHLNGNKLTLLRKILTKKPVVIEQTRFVEDRANSALPKILDAIDHDMTLSAIDRETRKNLVRERYEEIARENLYAIMDYVHFKGEGVLESERNDLRPNGWGLRQVFETMDPTVIDSKGYLEAFIQAAIALYPDSDDYDYKARYGTYSTFFYYPEENRVQKQEWIFF